MTKQIRKDAPEGAEYFQVMTNCVVYYMCDEEGRVYIADDKTEWRLMRYMSREDLMYRKDIHSLYMPTVLKWFAIVALVAAFALIFGAR